MTEIQFLLDIVLHCKNLKQVKDKCLARIGEVEAMLVKPPATMPRPLLQSAQAPSTQRLMEQMAQDTGAPVPVIAQTPATAAALESRNLAIKQATSGKPEPGRTSPRKF